MSFSRKKINWQQMLSAKNLPTDSYYRNFHIKDVLIEFMNNNQVSIERFENQCERLFELVVEIEKLEIRDKFIVVEKKEWMQPQNRVDLAYRKSDNVG